jgi:hypothetical protein
LAGFQTVPFSAGCKVNTSANKKMEAKLKSVKRCLYCGKLECISVHVRLANTTGKTFPEQGVNTSKERREVISKKIKVASCLLHLPRKHLSNPCLFLPIT